MHKLEEKIRAANKAGRYALVPFVTAGFPYREKFWSAIDELDSSGADILEIGVPFSDPVADGPVVEEASRRALEAGVNLAEILNGLKKRKFKAGIVLMGYYNPFLQYGLEKLAADAADAGVNGFIVPDLPLEEATPMRDALTRHNLALIPLVGPNTTKERMALYAREAKGYVYVVSVLGTTGAREKVADSVSTLINMAKQTFNVPVALGFGLQKPSQLEALRSRPDAAVFGSALLKHLDCGKSAGEFMAAWKRD